MQTIRMLLLVGCCLTVGFGCDAKKTEHREPNPEVDAYGFSAPTAATVAKHQELAAQLQAQEASGLEEAMRGLIASPENSRVQSSNGETIWDMAAYDFISGEAPTSVHPGLWLQESINKLRGLFQVAEGVYQLRGFDLANMTIIEGETGWIVVDPLTSQETASAALDFAREHLGQKPIKAIIFTHSHIDHFGGALGVASPEEVVAQRIRVIAPSGFMEEATSENVIAGIAMGRRAALMYGLNLPRTERAQIGSGLGKHPAMGTFGILKPTELVENTGTELSVDGVRMVFQSVPESEAPAEFTFFMPDKNIFVGAELVSRTMHNLYTLRGANVRNAITWSEYINEALALFGDADVLVNSHHWPMWGNTRIRAFLAQQRDMYRYLHDQSVRMINMGFNGSEIAEVLTLPAGLAEPQANRGYYGSAPQNAKAVYQYYMGWFDANPANLNPLPPTARAAKYVALAGGADALFQHAQKAYDDAEYRWAAELLNHLVFNDSKGVAAKNLLALCYDQLGYQAESGPWRNMYLSGAYELRHGKPEKGVDMQRLAHVLANTSLHNIFSSMAVRVNADKAKNRKMRLLFDFTDVDQRFELNLGNGVLRYRELVDGEVAEDVNVTLHITRQLFNKLVVGQGELKDLVFSSELDIDGDRLDLITFLRMLEKPDGLFNIVTP